MLRKKEIDLNQEFKEAFTYFYNKVKEYYKKRNYSVNIDHLDICDYITGYLLIGGSFDKE